MDVAGVVWEVIQVAGTDQPARSLGHIVDQEALLEQVHGAPLEVIAPYHGLYQPIPSFPVVVFRALPPTQGDATPVPPSVGQWRHAHRTQDRFHGLAGPIHPGPDLHHTEAQSSQHGS